MKSIYSFHFQSSLQIFSGTSLTKSFKSYFSSLFEAKSIFTTSRFFGHLINFSARLESNFHSFIKSTANLKH
jgi:hypothetical protein